MCIYSAIVVCIDSAILQLLLTRRRMQPGGVKPEWMASAESIKEVPFVKYLGHVISADMKYDRDIMRQCRQL